MDRDQVVELVREHLAHLEMGAGNVEEASTFSELGLTSLEVVLILIEVQRECHLEEGWIAEVRLPVTVGELTALVQAESGGSHV